MPTAGASLVKRSHGDAHLEYKFLLCQGESIFLSEVSPIISPSCRIETYWRLEAAYRTLFPLSSNDPNKHVAGRMLAQPESRTSCASAKRILHSWVLPALSFPDTELPRGCHRGKCRFSTHWRRGLTELGLGAIIGDYETGCTFPRDGVNQIPSLNFDQRRAMRERQQLRSRLKCDCRTEVHRTRCTGSHFDSG